MRRPLLVEVFIACPGDVADVKEQILQACEVWNDTRSASEDIWLRPITWDRQLAITSNSSPQDLVNRQLLSGADILIGIFWKSFGSQTDKYGSGTEEEVEQFLKDGKPVIMYFIDRKAALSEVDPGQLAKIHAFRERYKKSSTYRVIDDTSAIFSDLLKDLDHNVGIVRNKASSLTSPIDSEERTSPAGHSIVWYEQSINALIREYLNTHNLSHVPYRKGITWQENVHLNRGIAGITSSTLRSQLERAREHAFNVKYGSYDYAKDLRVRHSNWFSGVLDIFKSCLPNGFADVIGVGSNSGQELMEIFSSMERAPRISILDISEAAINVGRDRFPEFTFHTGNMEDSPLPAGSFDVYLNLRSIHSSGVELKETLAEAHRILRPSGLCVVSISNGYLTPARPGASELVEVKGMFDTRSELFLPDKPYRLAEKVREKLDDYAFTRTGLLTGPAEVFVWGVKSS